MYCALDKVNSCSLCGLALFGTTMKLGWNDKNSDVKRVGRGSHPMLQEGQGRILVFVTVRAVKRDTCGISARRFSLSRALSLN